MNQLGSFTLGTPARVIKRQMTRYSMLSQAFRAELSQNITPTSTV